MLLYSCDYICKLLHHNIKNEWPERKISERKKISVARNGHFFSLILRISACEKSKFQGKWVLCGSSFFIVDKDYRTILLSVNWYWLSCTCKSRMMCVIKIHLQKEWTEVDNFDSPNILLQFVGGMNNCFIDLAAND